MKKEVRELWKMSANDNSRFIILATNLEEAIAIFSTISEYEPQHIDCIGAEIEAPNVFS